VFEQKTTVLFTGEARHCEDLTLLARVMDLLWLGQKFYRSVKTFEAVGEDFVKLSSDESLRCG
jgi:hypothetical protein